MQIVRVLFAVVILQLLPTHYGRASADPTNNSNKRVPACHIEQFAAYNALHDISQKAAVVIGVEAVVDYKTEPTVKLDFPGGTLADLLNMFVSQVPEYRWSEDDGLIHVFRNAAHLPIADVLMSYPGARDKTREEIWEDIAARPEIKTWLDSNHCSRQELFNGKEFRSHNGRISIDPGSMTLAQLLDEVAVKSGVNYWAILQSPPGKTCQLSIFLW
jgi:hypothetical protein